MREIILNEDVKELHIPLVFDSEESARVKLREAKAVLKKAASATVTLEVFAPRSFKGAVDEFVGAEDFPVNWICPLDEGAKPLLAGAHITAVAGCVAEFKKTEKGAKAAMYGDGENLYVRTFGVLANDGCTDPYRHAADNLAELEAAVGLFGFSYSDIVRTWFYNDDILSWYAPFNKARTEFYSARKIFDGLLPASTGIGAPNPSGQLMTSGAIAVKNDGGRKVADIASPLQCGATSYGSSFARAVEIESPTSRRVMVSGTASIKYGGETAYVGDIDKQVDLTMRVIGAILKSRKMTFADTVRSIVYCLSPEYYASFLRWQKEHGEIPHCPSFSIICRKDLLFEVELEAAK